ncbi:putative ribonuclease H-like domain-containing protein [Tanacetum coccineum]
MLLWEIGKMLLSPQHAGFGDQQEMLLTIPSKTVDHTCLKELTMLIYKADSSHGCSRHMTGNKSLLTDYQEVDGGFVVFAGSPKGGGLTCLFAKATIDESNLWHMRLGHINFKTMNKLVRGSLVRGLPSKLLKMTILVLLVRRESNTKLLVRPSLFSWVFFLTTKDETSGILKIFITGIENQINHKVKIIKCDNGTEFKNNDMNQFCGMKGIKREFSAKAVSTACYVQNMVLVTKPHNKTPYELLHGRPPSISFMRLFRCPVTVLNTLDPLGKFDEKADEGFFVRYSINSKTFRVFNTRTKKAEENLHINFLENKLNVAGSRLDWLFDIDLLTNSMNYEPVTAGNKTNKNAGIKDNVDALHTQQYMLLPLLYDSPQSSKDTFADDAGKKTNEELANKGERNGQEKEGGKEGYANNTNRDSTVSPSVNTARQNFTNADDFPTDPFIPDLEDTGIFSGAYDDEDVGAEADLNNLETTMNVKPKKVIQALTDPSWIEAMQEELLQFKLQKVWTLVDLPKGYTQEEGIDYDEVFAPVARTEAIKLFLAYASFMGFIVYQMDVKSAFLYNTIKEEVYVCQPPSFEDPQFPDKIYKVEKALYGLHQAPRAWYETLSTYLLKNGFRRGIIDKILFIKKDKEFESLMHKKFQMSSMGELTFFLGLQVMQSDGGIFISQDKYVADILKKFDFVTVKTASTPIETNKALLKDEEVEDVDVHLYRSMIGSLMHLIASRPDIMFTIYACARFQVTPKVSHLHAVKRIFRYLKGQPKLGLWYPRDSPFDLEAFSDSDYAGASLDRKSTTGAEYVVAANCCGRVLWNQNQMLDYRDSYEKKLIQVIKIHTDHNVADLLTKAFDGTDSGSGPRCQDTILGGTEAQIRFEAASKQSNDPPLLRVNILGSGEDNMKLKELMELFNAVRLNLLLPVLVYATRHSLTAVRHKLMLPGILPIAGLVNTVRFNLILLVQVNAVKVAFLEKPEESNGFKEIIDFLNTSSVQYALTVNPTIYTTCIEQFWTPAKLDDVEGTNCLPTATIFAELERMGAKTTSWNEFSSTMASAITCLATNQKFNLSKYIFDNMVKNLDGWGFFGRVTPLFSTMMVQAIEDMGADSATPTDYHSIPIITQPSSSKPQKKKSRRKQRKDSAPTKPTTEETTPKEHVSTPSYDPPPSGEDRMQLAELISLCTNLQEKLEKRRKSSTSGLRRLRKVGSSSMVESSNDASLGAQVDASKQGRKIKDLDADAEVTLVTETQEINDDNLMFDTGVLEEQEVEFKKVVAEPGTTTKSIPFSAAEVVTTTSASEEQVPTSTKTCSFSQSQLPQVKDKGKGKMVKPEVPLKKKDQVALDEEMARNLEAQLQAELMKKRGLQGKRKKKPT